jgi:magnesium chelatase family protein
MNPCPCGWYGDPVKECTCSNAMISRYQADQRRPPDLRPVAGPRRSSIGQPSEAHVEVPRVEAGSASRTKSGPTSGWASRRTCSSRTGAIQARVEAARERQRQRFGAGSGLLSKADALANPRVGPAEVRDHCPVDDACARLAQVGRNLLRAAMQQRPGASA